MLKKYKKCPALLQCSIIVDNYARACDGYILYFSTMEMTSSYLGEMTDKQQPADNRVGQWRCGIVLGAKKVVFVLFYGANFLGFLVFLHSEQ